ncbi:hypothetical protein [Pseudonocardia hydrocarbonoxydans]|uniref:Uncharacterized protein n=1 Tax=Pseudonocardia hydrocarbonoxydans TaxID=76726 RepID=A0A4Y3WIT3_9PSEU|nr:hypothetical protein [Pseudonocardia hydrocarbonoxydans]GEC18655.1 hypothetical protein PHY01_09380 [Pseudonocardia hydrocarbonoxydans]
MAFVPWTISPPPDGTGRGSIALPLDPLGESAVLPEGSGAWVRVAAYADKITVSRLACHGTTHTEYEPGTLEAGGDHAWEIPEGTYQVELDYECSAPFAVLVSTLAP